MFLKKTDTQSPRLLASSPPFGRREPTGRDISTHSLAAQDEPQNPTATRLSSGRRLRPDTDDTPHHSVFGPDDEAGCSRQHRVLDPDGQANS